MVSNINNYRDEKINFVSNLNGTTLGDLTTFTSTIPIISLLLMFIKLFIVYVIKINSIKNDNKYKIQSSLWSIFVIDYLFYAVPIVLMTTLLSNHISQFQIVLTIVIFLIFNLLFSNKFSLVKSYVTNNQNNENDNNNENVAIDDAIKFRVSLVNYTLSSYRTMVYVVTAISILAVDFKVFPRRYAKTENYGIAHMDLGVGFFVLCHALKSIQKAQDEPLEESIFEGIEKLPSKLYNTIKSSSILIIMGILRLISVKSTGYVEHISEYGIHWNFLFTLAVVKIVACPFQIYIRRNSLRALLIAITIAFSYEYLLKNANFTKYLLYDHKKHEIAKLNFINANKEGIFSCLGYMSIYFAGQSICFYLTSNAKHKSSNIYVPIFKCLIYLLFLSSFYYVLLQFSKQNLDDVSRRLCNFSFMCFILLSGTLLLALFLSAVLIITNSLKKLNKLTNIQSTNVQQTISDYIFSNIKIIDSKFVGLLIFIASNVLTGVVNLSINTLQVSDLHAVLILHLYIAATLFLGYILYSRLNSKKKNEKQND